MTILDSVFTVSDIPKGQELLKKVFTDVENNPEKFNFADSDVYAEKTVKEFFPSASADLYNLLVTIVYSYVCGYHSCYIKMKEKEDEQKKDS